MYLKISRSSLLNPILLGSRCLVLLLRVCWRFLEKIFVNAQPIALLRKPRRKIYKITQRHAITMSVPQATCSESRIPMNSRLLEVHILGRFLLCVHLDVDRFMARSGLRIGANNPHMIATKIGEPEWASSHLTPSLASNKSVICLKTLSV